MADLNSTMKRLRQLPGNAGAALVDVKTGMSLAQIGRGSADLDTDAAAYAAFLRQKALGTPGEPEASGPVEEMVFISRLHYHLVFPLQVQILKFRPPESAFFLIVMKKEDVSLAAAQAAARAVLGDFQV